MVSSAAASRTSDVQSDVIAFLGSPASYPGRISEVTRVETHAAMVFLAGDRAYKLKRAVKLPYLDFTTLDKRHHVLLHELEINSKISPELYIEVAPITRNADSGKISLGGTGEVVDWVLVMQRFDEHFLFNRMASQGPLESQHIEELSNAIEHFHRQSVPCHTGSWAKALSDIADDLEDSLTTSEAASAGLELKPYIAHLRQELLTQGPLIEARQQAGFVRRCHGDLHLGNIVLWQGKARLFDALEFDDALATIDVLYDLAFLLMDLWYRGRKREANTIFNHAMRSAAISEVDGIKLLPLYLSLRAAIRAMTGVHSLAFRQGEERDRTLKEIRRYAALAEDLLRRRLALLVAIGGLSGTGKTTAAREVAPFIGAPPGALHLRTDIERKVMLGIDLNRRLPSSRYTAETSDQVYQRVFKKAEIALDAGHSVIADAVFPDQVLRARARITAEHANASFFGFWLEAPFERMRERVSTRIGDASDADAEIVAVQLKTITPSTGWFRIEGSGQIGEAAREIMRRLKLRQEK
ncbi:MAG: AAA family ATPase [Rhodomicrobium sp.]